jgi:hypothetical protein
VATLVVAFWVFHIAIRKDAEAVLRLMNSTGCLEVDRRLCSTTAITLCSRVSSSDARILDFNSSVRARVRWRSSITERNACLRHRRGIYDGQWSETLTG